MISANTMFSNVLGSIDGMPANCPYCCRPYPRERLAVGGRKYDVPCTDSCTCEQAAAERARRDGTSPQAREADFCERLERAGIGRERYEEARRYTNRGQLKRAAQRIECGGNVLVCGGNGRGKTLLAIALCAAALRKGKTALMATSADLISDVYRGYGGECRDLMERAKGVFLFALDDLGKENATPQATTTVYQVLNARYEAGRPTVVTTNLNGGELAAHFALADDAASGKAIVSRIMADAEVIRMEGADMRVSSNKVSARGAIANGNRRSWMTECAR